MAFFETMLAVGWRGLSLNSGFSTICNTIILIIGLMHPPLESRKSPWSLPGMTKWNTDSHVVSLLKKKDVQFDLFASMPALFTPNKDLVRSEAWEECILAGCTLPQKRLGSFFLRPRSVAKKFCIVTVTSNLAAHACSTKCRWKKKLITQLVEKSRDETFEPN